MNFSRPVACRASEHAGAYRSDEAAPLGSYAVQNDVGVAPASVAASSRDRGEHGHRRHHFRFHQIHTHLASPFGADSFGKRAEAFARFFGTPTFLITQTIVVAGWIALNVAGVTRFDLYPFILLNLAFSTQAAYAAPLILLAQTRQADRDKVHADADALHREALAVASEERQRLAAEQTARVLELLEQNTRLTTLTQELSAQIERLTAEIHAAIVRSE